MALRKRKDIVVLVAPLHGVSATRRELRRARNLKNFQGHRPDVIAYSEGSSPKKKGFFRGLPRWKQFTGPFQKPDARGRQVAWDVVLEYKRWFKSVWRQAAKWADASMPLKIAPERWGVEQDLRIRRRDYAFIFDHPHAGIQATPDDAWAKDRLKEYKKQAVHRSNAIRSAIGRKLPVIAGGDLNYPPGDRYEWTPQSVFERFNMKWRRVDVTWVAWTPDMELAKVEEIPRSVNGQDHGWLLVTLRYVG